MFEVRTTLIFAAAVSFGFVGNAFAASAYVIDVFGTKMAPEAHVVERVDWLISSGYLTGDIDTIVTVAYGIEGGKSVCIEQPSFARNNAIDALANAIKNVRHDPTKTVINATPTETCQVPH